MSSRSVLAVLWIACAIGCRENELSKLEASRDEICACKTVACGDAAMARVPVVPGAGNRRSQVIAREMMNCLAKLYDSDKPKAGPDNESEDATDEGSAAESGSAVGSGSGSAR